MRCSDPKPTGRGCLVRCTVGVRERWLFSGFVTVTLTQLRGKLRHSFGV